jgi:hypothetical protein
MDNKKHSVKCKLCNRTLVKIGLERKNGKYHKDWNTRTLHKNCWIKKDDYYLETSNCKCDLNDAIKHNNTDEIIRLTELFNEKKKFLKDVFNVIYK